MQVYLEFDVDIVPLACIFIKSKNPVQVFSSKFCEFFQPITLLKMRLQHRCFSVSFSKLLRRIILQNIPEELIIASFVCKIYTA